MREVGRVMQDTRSSGLAQPNSCVLRAEQSLRACMSLLASPLPWPGPTLLLVSSPAGAHPVLCWAQEASAERGGEGAPPWAAQLPSLLTALASPRSLTDPEPRWRVALWLGSEGPRKQPALLDLRSSAAHPLLLLCRPVFSPSTSTSQVLPLWLHKTKQLI